MLLTALQAFEVEALDYLLKPFAPARFRRLLGRLRRHLAEPPAPDLADRLDRLLDQLDRDPVDRETPGSRTESVEPLRRILVERDTDRQVLLPVERIDRIRAEGNYVCCVGPDGTFRRRGTLRELDERLDSEAFLRVNRSEIVRLAAIAEIQPWFRGDYRILLHDGTVLSWSRRYRARAPAELRE
ncbi:MAG: response regulator transcription factor [Acidobacteriota bacterium]